MGDITVGSVAVDVVPSAKGWINKLRAQILPDADRLGIEVGRTLSARINESLGNAHLTVDVDSAVADAQLATTEAIVDRLDGRKINVDVGAVGGGSGGLGSLFASFSESLASSVASTGPLAIGLSAVAALMVPIAASAAGLAAALVLPLAAAGGGLGLGAILAGKAVANTLKTAKAIDQLRTKAAGLTGQARKDALDQANTLEKTLTAPQKAFLKAKDGLSKAFSGLFKGKVGAALFAPITAGMNLLAKIMPALKPVIIAVSGALTGLLKSLDKSASGKGFKDFIDGFAKLAGATITGGAKTAGKFIEGLFNIFKDFLPLSSSVGTGLQGLAGKFLAFSQKTSTKQGIQSFIEYVKENGPKILRTIGELVKTVINLAKGAAPYGATLLAIFNAFLRAYNGFGPKLRGVFNDTVAAVRAMGRAFRSVYNATIGPVMAAIIQAIAKVMQVTGKMLSLLGHAPGFGWAKKLGDSLQTAAGQANGLADAIRKIPTKHDTKIVITTVHKGGRTISGSGGKSGSAYASGTDNSAEGPALVGEKGPELVYLPGGSKVVTADVTSRMLSTATPSSPTSTGPHRMRVDGIGRDYIELVADDRISAVTDFAGTLSRQA